MGLSFLCACVRSKCLVNKFLKACFVPVSYVNANMGTAYMLTGHFKVVEG